MWNLFLRAVDLLALMLLIAVFPIPFFWDSLPGSQSESGSPACNLRALPRAGAFLLPTASYPLPPSRSPAREREKRAECSR